jgi:hypothetical protein
MSFVLLLNCPPQQAAETNKIASVQAYTTTSITFQMTV